ncbi:MAG: serine hydrolase [Bacteroidota bacterium]
MKSIITALLSTILLQSSTAQSSTDTTKDLIKKVENGLITNQIYIAGDSTYSIEDRMAHYGIPGVSIAVIHNGKIAWTKGFGVMDKETKVPVTDQTLFQASSVSIPVSAYGVLRLVEEDNVPLDENINNLLSSWQLPDNEFTKEKKATIRNLLNHSAGINLHATPGYSLNSSRPTLIEVLNGTPPAKNEPIGVNKEPDESYYISYTGYGIIQQMMMDIKGEPFHKIMSDLVLQPLGMTNSSFDPTLSPSQLTKAATAYFDDGAMVEGKRFVHPISASRGLWTTAEDLAKFIIQVQQTLNGKSDDGLSKEMTKLMVTPHSVSSYGPGSEYGLGFQILTKKKEVYLRHWGWNTGFYSEFMAHRDNEFGVVVMTNSTFPAFNAEVIRSVALAYEWDDYMPVYEKVEVESSLVDVIFGRYQTDNRVIEIFQKDNKLYAKYILDTEPDEIVKVSDHLYARRGTTRLIRFESNPNDETVNLLEVNDSDNSVIRTLVKLADLQKEPVEFLVEGEFEKAVSAYKAFMKQNPDHPTATEDYIDDLGEHFSIQGRTQLSLSAFELNTMLYPNNYQVYDRYATYCERAGEIDLAILNYSKSIELNPQNNSAREKLKELQESK